MTLSVNQHAKAKSRRKNNRFQKLWKRAERLQRENETLNRRLEALIALVRAKVFPAQVEVGRASRDLVLRLLSFLHRKSLTRRERGEIRGWVEELLELIVAAGLMDDALREALARDTALQMGYVIDEHSDVSPLEQVEAALEDEQQATEDFAEAAIQRMIDDEVEKMVRETFGKTRPRPPVEDLFQAELNDAERRREAEIEQFRREANKEVKRQIEAGLGINVGDLFDDLDDEMDDEMDDEYPDDDNAQFDDQRSTHPATEPGILNRLFRRTANVLHPDKERDESRRERRQALMGELLDARKKGDILTIFRLHREHVGTDPAITADDEKQFLAALQRQVENLGQEKEAIIHQSPLHTHVYQAFFAKSRKQCDAKIARQIQELNRYAADLTDIVTKIRTLKALKSVLGQRIRPGRLRAASGGPTGSPFQW